MSDLTCYKSVDAADAGRGGLGQRRGCPGSLAGATPNLDPLPRTFHQKSTCIHFRAKTVTGKVRALPTLDEAASDNVAAAQDLSRVPEP